MNILKNSTNVLGTEFKVIDALTGLPKNNLTSVSGELQLWYYRKDKGKVNISLTDIQSNSEYTSGGVCNISDGIYRVDLPNDAFVEGSDYVTYGGYSPNSIVIGKTIQLTNAEVEKEIFTDEILNIIADKVTEKFGKVLTIEPSFDSKTSFVLLNPPEDLNEQFLTNAAFLHQKSGITSRITGISYFDSKIIVYISPDLLAVPEAGDKIIVFGKYLENL